MLLVYLPRETNRTKYIFRLLLGDLLGLGYKTTTDIETFKSYAGPRFSYCRMAPDEALHITAHNLLFQRGIETTETGFGHFEGLPILFKTFNPRSALPFDLFAASFFMVSRYEEYLPYRRDDYGRFSARESLAYQKDFLHRPVINIWSLILKDVLQQHWPDLKFKLPVYRCEPTIDIDSAYSLHHKGFLRTIGGFGKSLRKLNLSEMALRARVIAGTVPDPFDVFEQFHELHNNLNLKPIYFILFADYGRFDKNVPIQNQAFRMLIKSLADNAQVGIHPSYQSNNSFSILRREVGQFGTLLNTEITRSRQHFLKL
ncbi:MAG: hypothetical protein CVU06_16370, partial [Bacteroidetes bacterium HGW-Bacteroidetes-22]